MRDALIYAFLLILIFLVSCQKENEAGKDEEVVLHPTTVIGPVDGAEGVSLVPTFVIGDYDASVNTVTASYITIGDYSSGPSFMDYIIVTRDTLDENQFIKLGSSNSTEYPYPPQLPTSQEIHKTVKAYFYPNSTLEPSTEYYWKVVHDAGDFLLDVIPYRKFKTVPIYDQESTLEFVDIEGGEYCMGSRICNQDPNRNTKVTVNSFRIGKYEITNLQFCNFLNNQNLFFLNNDLVDIFSGLCKINFDFNQGRWKPQEGMDEYPIDAVQWNGALSFCQTYGGRLPTEAEWEYAAKGGQKSQGFLYSGGDNPDEVAWFNCSSPRKVGLKNPNELGIFDMSGNVSEWCSDWYYAEPNTLSGIKWGVYSNPTGPENGTRKVIRGGSARHISLYVFGRDELYPATNFENYSGPNVGFRMISNMP